MSIYNFHQNFLWGASTSAFQIEGAYDKGGKGPATTDRGTRRQGIADNKIASDHYHHWKEDVDLMAELGLKAYRMSFSWSRIMPDVTGRPNMEGLEFYDHLIDYLLKKGIEPIVTLYHFECPQALVDEFGGWMNRRMIDAYEQYAETCFNFFKGRVKYWITVNEQLIATAIDQMTGVYTDDPMERMKNAYQMSYNVSLAEHKAFSLLKKIDPEAKIGPVSAIQVVYAQTGKSEDVLAADNAEEILEYYLLDMSVYGKYSPYMEHYLREHDFYPYTESGDENILRGSKPDFIGVNYYFSICVKEKVGTINFNQAPFFISDAFEE